MLKQPNTVDKRDHCLRDDFVERVGVISQAEGFPRIAGRVFAYLLYEGGEHSFADLAKALSVSRGSISTSARMLVEHGVIERVGKPGDRQDWFRASEDAFTGLLRNAAERAVRARQSVEKSVQAMPDETDAERDRLERVRRYAAFYEAMESGLNHAAERMDFDNDRSHDRR